jgi:hypothetical protein
MWLCGSHRKEKLTVPGRQVLWLMQPIFLTFQMELL